MPDNSQFKITYKNYSIYQSQNLAGEDNNSVFDGIKLKVSDFSALDIDLIEQNGQIHCTNTF